MAEVIDQELRAARDRLAVAQYELGERDKAWLKRDRYLRGDIDLPFAPDGVSEEYMALREQSRAPWLPLVMSAPVQRLDCVGWGTPGLFERAWTDQGLASRQNTLYLDMVVHGEGVVGLWPVDGGVRVSVESSRNVWRDVDPSDNTREAWQCKIARQYLDRMQGTSRAWRYVAWVHDADGTYRRFVTGDRTGDVAGVADDWTPDGVEESSGTGTLPFVTYGRDLGGVGRPWPAIEALIPAQDAITTVRFNTLLAMQYSAYRQRIITNMDPVVRDEDGNPVWQKDADGADKIDLVTGLRIPVTASLGRASVDRFMLLNGDSQVYDLPESNLANYIEVLQELTTDLFARGQVPPQYLLSRMANLSGDALAGAESTMRSLVRDLRQVAGEGHRELARRCARALGVEVGAVRPEWAEVEARSFAQIVDGVQKLITSGFPRRAAWLLLPDATPERVDDWVREADREAERAAERDPLRGAFGGPVTDDAADPAASGA